MAQIIYKGYSIEKIAVGVKKSLYRFIARHIKAGFNTKRLILATNYQHVIDQIDFHTKALRPMFMILYRDGVPYYAPMENGAYDYGVGDITEISAIGYGVRSDVEVFKNISFTQPSIDKLPF